MGNQEKISLLDELKTLLGKDKRFIADGQLLKNTIVEHALKLDKNLIRLLLSKKRIKEHFFCDIDGTLVFDKDEFISFVDNKQFLPDSYTAFKNKIGLTLDGKDDYLKERKDVCLVWPYKDCVLEGGQTKEDQKRDEIFWNETLAPDEIDRLTEPKVLTNFKRFDKNGEHKVSEIKDTDNLIIKGNNLLALHSLKKRFAGKVKLIYIDPLYNIDTDAFYNESFNHSSWLTFMKNRLEVARDMLHKDGALFVQIDDTEQAYLKTLCDEIFGRENFVSTVAWQRAPEGRTVLGQGATFVIASKEYILIYSKTPNSLKKKESCKKRVEATQKVLEQYGLYFINAGTKKLVKEIEDTKGNPIKIYKHLNYSVEKVPRSKSDKERIRNFSKLARIAAQQEESTLQQKILSEIKEHKSLHSVEYIPSAGKNKGRSKSSYYLDGGIILFAKDYAETDGENIYRLADINDFWSHDDIPVTGISNEGGVTLRRGKKPEQLLQRIIQMVTEKEEIVLDFFLGSGTTAAVAHKMGRQYVGIEQLDYGKNDSVVRLKNVINGDQSGISKSVNWEGGGDFVYCELMKWNEAYIDRIQKAKAKTDLAKTWQVMKEKAHISYKIDLKEFDKNASDFEQLSSSGSFCLKYSTRTSFM